MAYWHTIQIWHSSNCFGNAILLASVEGRFPFLSKITSDAIWKPVNWKHQMLYECQLPGSIRCYMNVSYMEASDAMNASYLEASDAIWMPVTWKHQIPWMSVTWKHQMLYECQLPGSNRCSMNASYLEVTDAIWMRVVFVDVEYTSHTFHNTNTC